MGRMTSDPQPLDLGILLGLAFQEFVRELRAHLADAGFPDLRRSDGFVFRALAAGPLTVTDLAARLAITKQGAGQLVNDMERRGYVERRPDPADRRAKLLALTPHGTAALTTARRFHHAYETRLTTAHGPAALAALRTVLTTVTGPAQTENPRLHLL